MKRKLASIRKINKIKPIPNADVIEAVGIDGWWCVAKKGEFKINDLCVYFEIDSFIPPVEPFLFLENKGRKKMLYDGDDIEGYRLKTVKLRGQISQGMALPLTFFKTLNTVKLGDDVTDLLNVKLYEGQQIANIGGNIKGKFPSFIPKTDEERIQNLKSYLEKFKGKSFTITEKLDGTSCTIYKHKGKFGVCSRNRNLKNNNTFIRKMLIKFKISWLIIKVIKLFPKSGRYLYKLKPTKSCLYWDIFEKYDIKRLLPDNTAIQGEIIGEGIQKNRLKQKGHLFKVFYIYDIKNQKYLENGFIKELKYVPVIDNDFILNHTLEELLEMANRKSLLNPKVILEGLVFRLNNSEEKISFKVISNKYLLKYGE